jgi:hypothetical protein
MSALPQRLPALRSLFVGGSLPFAGFFWREIAIAWRSITSPACIRLAKIALTCFSQTPVDLF